MTVELPVAEAPEDKRFRILALDGGGIRGAYTAGVLAALEAATGQRCVDHFDLMAGTSTGGLLAIGLAMGVPASTLSDFYRDHGSNIFPLTGPVTKIRRSARQLFRPKYDHAELRTTLHAVLGDMTMADAKTRLVIPSYDITEGRIFLFKTGHDERFQFDLSLPATEIALATSAAPTYFPAQLIGDHANVAYIDGGVWANSPSLVGVVEAIGFLGQRVDDLDVLSIGTTMGVPDFGGQSRSGLIKWGTGLINMFMTAQSQGSVAMTEVLTLKDRHHRINAVVPDDWSAMDNPSRVGDLIARGNNDAKKDANLRPATQRFLNGKHVAPFVPSTPS